MDLGIKGRKALVTGASSGLGYSAAEALALEGVELIINSRSSDKLEDAAKKIEKACGKVPVTIAADVGTDDGLKLIESAIADHGPIDILVSNAGGPPPGMFLDHDSATWQKSAKLVLDSAVNLTRMVVPGMIESKWGRLVYITSVGVLQPIDALILSNTYRAGVTGFCKTMSNTYASHGITANCVCPGYTATERLQNLAKNAAEESGQSPEDVINGYASVIPARRVGEPEELASLIAFLSSEKAAYISGASIAVDGGFNRALI